MPRRQCLDRGDTRNNVVVDLDKVAHQAQYPQRAVIQRRITPGQKSTHPPWLEFRFDRRGPYRGSRLMPVGHRLQVVTDPGTGRVDQFDEPVSGPGDESPADLPAQRHQVVLRLALVHGEEHLGVVEGRDGRGGDVLGVARTDPDDVNGSHRRRVSVAARTVPASIRYRGY